MEPAVDARLARLAQYRIEAGDEQLHQHARNRRIARHRALDIRVAEGRADLPQILGVCAQDRHLARIQLRAQHEPIEIVAFNRAGPHLLERFFEEILHALDVELGVVREFEAEVVNPCGRRAQRLDQIGPLFIDTHAEMFEHRQTA